MYERKALLKDVALVEDKALVKEEAETDKAEAVV